MLRGLAALAVAAISLWPLVWTVLVSLRPQGLPLPTTLSPLPAEPTLANYPALLEAVPFLRYTLNSVVVALGTLALTLLSASLAGCALAQLPPHRRAALVVTLVGALMIPAMALWVPRFLVFKWLGVLDTWGALWLPAALAANPLHVLILYWSCRRIPPEIFDVARLDGASALRVWWSIALPLIQPALAAVAVLAVAYSWNSFTEPLLYLNRDDLYTLPLGLRALRQLHPSRWSLLMAGATAATLPVLGLFLVAQRYFLQEHRGGGWLGR